MRPRIAVFCLGGTIAMAEHAQREGAVPALGADGLLAAVPGVGEWLDLEVHDLMNVPSASLRMRDVVRLAAAVRAGLDGGADAAVVVQGTDTLEETSYLLDLLHGRDEPLVVTGAMRTSSAPGSDGPANLLAALQVASSPDARSLGCLVTLADEVHAARYVAKTHTHRVHAFSSEPWGPMGYVAEGQLRLLAKPAVRFVLDAGLPARSPTVPLVVTCLGDEGELLDAVGEKADGLVVAAMGAGHVPASVVPRLAALASRMPVVLASRTGAGTVLSSTYGFAGSESDLLGRGLISAGTLNPLKARILLWTLLAVGTPRAEIADRIAAAGTVTKRRARSR
ncbi:asparaginase [Thermoactinospora rubra]|uniref:asparaginase n=1 Tax=Thermoactinospora rubra TaxID=1088767 RepID=UPI000A11533B|nr:asparaginase [Thermoactinospora rubra]